MRRAISRPGVTLIELLIAVSIMTMMIGALGAMARAVQLGAEFSEGQALATQHARVAMERIGRAVQEATANETYPGVFGVDTQLGTWKFPETLVVWRPDGNPVDPAGGPRLHELLIFCPNPSKSNELLEIRAATTDTRVLEPWSNLAARKTQIDSIKSSGTSKRIVLTPLLRTALITGVPGGNKTQAGVRFEVAQTPTIAEWQSFRSGSLAWDQLPWVQSIYGPATGLRQTRVRIELQLMPGEEWVVGNPSGQRAVPFLGAATLQYEMQR